MKNHFRILAFFICLLGALPVFALGPMYSSHDLVAGEGMPGLSDGPFYSALFNNPAGIAIDPVEDKLYVADQGNHCLRVIDLSKSNAVSTLAGQGKPGFKDGPLNQVLFNGPALLTVLPGHQLAVWDNGNYRIRLVDLNHKTVSTLAGGVGGDADGIGPKAQIKGVWSMACMGTLNALYFTQPDSGTLRRLNLKTGKVTTLVKADPRVPIPTALCAGDGKLYLAGKGLTTGFILTPKDEKSGFDWSLFACNAGTQRLAWTDGCLYALQADAQNPVAQLLPVQRPVDFYNPWGEPLAQPGRECFFPDSDLGSGMDWAVDPRNPRRFFLAHPSLNIITSFRDLHEKDLMPNESMNGDLMDFVYPEAKPPRVFRILLVGDSHVYHNDNVDQTSVSNRMLLTAKKLENDLNFQAALEDKPERFEVLALAHNSWFPLYLWPYYEVPPVARKYHIDTVLFLMVPLSPNLEVYLERPLTAEHIPDQKIDPEYLLKHGRDALRDPTVSELYNLCMAKKLVTPDIKGAVRFGEFGAMNQDPKMCAKMIELYTRPLKLLRQKLIGMETGTQAFPPWITCLMPPANFEAFGEKKLFWQGAAEEIGGPVLDLSGDWTGMRVTYYPLSELRDFEHYNGHGHELLALLLTHELESRQLIPWGPPKPAH